jgi:hypothetical protein
VAPNERGQIEGEGETLRGVWGQYGEQLGFSILGGFAGAEFDGEGVDCLLAVFDPVWVCDWEVGGIADCGLRIADLPGSVGLV